MENELKKTAAAWATAHEELQELQRQICQLRNKEAQLLTTMDRMVKDMQKKCGPIAPQRFVILGTKVVRITTEGVTIHEGDG